jgi:hypothetical protein
MERQTHLHLVPTDQGNLCPNVVALVGTPSTEFRQFHWDDGSFVSIAYLPSKKIANVRGTSAEGVARVQAMLQMDGYQIMMCGADECK